MAAVDPPRPLEAADVRDAFDCGRQSLNMWFSRHALANHVNGNSRVNVMAERATGRIVGYVSLSAAQIERTFLPKSWQRNRPDPVPVTLLGQLAVACQDQRQGHAASLLLFALKTALRASEQIGSAGVITHPLDDQVRCFYAKWGFETLEFDLGRTMMVRMVDLRRSFEV